MFLIFHPQVWIGVVGVVLLTLDVAVLPLGVLYEAIRLPLDDPGEREAWGWAFVLSRRLWGLAPGSSQQPVRVPRRASPPTGSVRHDHRHHHGDELTGFTRHEHAHAHRGVTRAEVDAPAHADRTHHHPGDHHPGAHRRHAHLHIHGDPYQGLTRHAHEHAHSARLEAAHAEEIHHHPDDHRGLTAAEQPKLAEEPRPAETPKPEKRTGVWRSR